MRRTLIDRIRREGLIEFVNTYCLLSSNIFTHSFALNFLNLRIVCLKTLLYPKFAEHCLIILPLKSC